MPRGEARKNALSLPFRNRVERRDRLTENAHLVDLLKSGVWFAILKANPPKTARRLLTGVNAEPGAGAFARTAVDALAQEGRVTRGNDVVIAGAESARKQGVFFAPADPVQLGAANRALERAGIPWKLGAVRSGPAPVTGSGLAGVSGLVPTTSGKASWVWTKNFYALSEQNPHVEEPIEEENEEDIKAHLGLLDLK